MPRQSRQQQQFQQLHAAGDEFSAAFASGEDDDMMMLPKRKSNQRRLPMIKKFHRTLLHKPGTFNKELLVTTCVLEVGRKSQRKRLIIVCLSISCATAIMWSMTSAIISLQNSSLP